jgi:5'-nucleotidase (lipoprotein e(P4) family)
MSDYQASWKRVGAVLLVLLAVAACQPSAQWRIDDSDAANPLSRATDWVAHSDEWPQQTTAAFRRAGDYVERVTQQAPHHSYAVVLDIDQTLLDNIGYQMELDRTGKAFSPETWREWVAAKQAKPVPGAMDFMQRMKQLGVHVALVSNRRDYEQLDTELNLAQLGLLRGRDFRVLLTRATPHGDSDKESRFALVAPMIDSMGYAKTKVIAYLGDVKGDHPKPLKGVAFFCIVQGGLYGEPCEQH